MADRIQIESLQLTRLRALVDELRSGNDFYRDRLKKAGIDGKIGSLCEFTAKMPLKLKFTRSDR